jgi:hypothetical protein
MGRECNCLGYVDGGGIVGVHHSCAGTTAAKKAGTSPTGGVASCASPTGRVAAGTSPTGGVASCASPTGRVAACASPTGRVAAGTSARGGVAADTAAARRRTGWPDWADECQTEPDRPRIRSPRGARDARPPSASGTQRASREAEIPGCDREQQILSDR